MTTDYNLYRRIYGPAYECLYTPLSFECVEVVPEEEPLLTEDEADKIYAEADEWKEGNIC
jgi:hypothetical protein